MVLGVRFRQALDVALHLHANQKRKGTQVPYAAHLLSTASLVLQFESRHRRSGGRFVLLWRPVVRHVDARVWTRRSTSAMCSTG
jgi:hypothetical protein